MGAVMQPGHLPQLQGIDDEADVAVLGEPGGVVLVGHLVAVGNAADAGAAVAAHV
jgi:hypothetical protein